jgi:hypothetical protein
MEKNQEGLDRHDFQQGRSVQQSPTAMDPGKGKTMLVRAQFSAPIAKKTPFTNNRESWWLRPAQLTACDHRLAQPRRIGWLDFAAGYESS